MSCHILHLLFGALILMSTKVHCDNNDYINVTFLKSALQKGAGMIGEILRWIGINRLDPVLATNKISLCLDGSPGAYYYAKGFGDGINNWIVYLVGGGWCASKEGCLLKNYHIGTSKNINVTISFGGILSQNKTTNPDFYNWNRVWVHYCDGSSFMSDVEEVEPETNAHRRGARIFKAVMEDLLEKGMKNSTNVILSGGSAGGFATILNCDRFRSLVPNASRVKCLVDSGFLIRAKDLPGAKGFREEYNARVVKFHKLERVLPKSCTSKMAPGLCLFTENVVGDVQTPLFLLNSAFDQFMIKYKLRPQEADRPCWENCTDHLELCTPGQVQTIKDFGATFLDTLKNISDISSRGLFINSCYIHGFIDSTPRWNGDGSPILGNKTIPRAIGDWYFDRSFVKLVDTSNDYPINCNSSLYH